MLQKKNSKPASKALAAGLLAAWMSVTPIANAAGPNEEPVNDASYTEGTPAVQSMSSVEIVELVKDYSVNNDAVGVFINVAPDVRNEGVTGEKIGAIIVGKLNAAGIAAAFLHNNASDGETRIDFYVQGEPYAGYALDRAVTDGFERVSTAYKALNRDAINFEVATANL